MKKPAMTRREFLGRSTVAAGGAALSAFALAGCQCPCRSTARKTAIDQVTLGRSGVQLSRLGMGTGSNSGDVQRGLGRDGFNRLVRYAYDRGITYIDTAESYRNHDWIRDAIQGLPRERLFLLTKISGTPEKPMQVLDRFRKELDTDYLDTVLCHYATTNQWPDERRRVMDTLEEAKERGIIKAKGVSCHGLPALTRATQVPWVDVHLVRINPQGHKVDGATYDFNTPGNVPAATKEIQAMRDQGRGIIGMKLIGNGDFTNPEDRERSIRYVMQSGLVDSVVIGFKSPAEIDEAIERIDRALANV